ncbi:hypothetical protein G3I59_37270 [Amycolatopsis rubida]|uniref:Uncharacterized protein n=1 Tax=Amycolatopsis rubida TaxID=112413 RepID=A0ABX0C039_9PSEU|nr:MULTISPECIES: hypothetical protein [Amycolatopsis]MYW96110.1 hypothetical protein [Amycolatopsis rubida]NEC61101.1 hypothetical protein [Amycolatopsis rubida]OAP23378.1 hypothetical protein A4R44_06025 [Amycolatopsis sp. M39]
MIAKINPVGPDYATYVPLALSVLLIFSLLTQPDGAAAVSAGQTKWLVRKIGFKNVFGNSS